MKPIAASLKTGKQNRPTFNQNRQEKKTEDPNK